MGSLSGREYGVAIPVRAFRLGNMRLASGLDDETRTALAQELAARVVAAAGPAPVVVVSNAPEVTAWARALGVDTVADPGSLDGAAHAGVDALAAHGCRRIVVAHADLPFVETFAAVTSDAGTATAVVVPCHRDDGTPVLSIPASARSMFAFGYGPGSFRRHVAAARAAALAVRVVRDPTLRFDVDTVDDLAVLARDDPSLLGTRLPASSPAR